MGYDPKEYYNYHQKLIENSVAQTMKEASLNGFAQQYHALIILLKDLLALFVEDKDTVMEKGQLLIVTHMRNYPQTNHIIPRDLLWFFGGDCLHFMPDDEIAKFQRLDDARFDAESNDLVFEREKHRSHIFGLH